MKSYHFNRTLQYGFTALVTYLLYLIRIPVTGSFSRTAVNCASGVKTPLGGIYTGALVLLALGLLMPFCAYIPKASLAAVIITAVIFRFVRSCTCLQCLCNVLVKMKAFSYRPTWTPHSHVLLTFSVEYEVVRPMWKSKKVDLIPAFATFVCCLIWALEYGILVGVGIQVLFILYNAARPSVVVQVHIKKTSKELLKHI